MREIGGYFEMEENQGREYHEGAIALNSGRNALAYLVEAAGYSKVYVPEFACDSISTGIRKGGGDVEIYGITEGLRPDFDKELAPNEAILIINYYGQIDNDEMKVYREKWKNVIVDNTQAFFQEPVSGMDTIYSCRKFFGVSDGAYIYTDKVLHRHLSTDVSVERMKFVLGRYDENASKYYPDSAKNNEFFDDVPVMFMSRLTHNLLRSIDYEKCAKRRVDNAIYLDENLSKMNFLSVKVLAGMFMYPLYLPYVDVELLRAYLHKRKVYVPCLWPDVLKGGKYGVAARLAANVVPLPCDHRYKREEMDYVVEAILDFCKRKSKRSKLSVGEKME